MNQKQIAEMEQLCEARKHDWEYAWSSEQRVLRILKTNQCCGSVSENMTWNFNWSTPCALWNKNQCQNNDNNNVATLRHVTIQRQIKVPSYARCFLTTLLCKQHSVSDFSVIDRKIQWLRYRYIETWFRNDHFKCKSNHLFINNHLHLFWLKWWIRFEHTSEFC